jgi:hypothetical protein
LEAHVTADWVSPSLVGVGVLTSILVSIRSQAKHSGADAQKLVQHGHRILDLEETSHSHETRISRVEGRLSAAATVLTRDDPTV